MELTRYEEFIAAAHDDWDTYYNRLGGDGSFQYAAQVRQLQELSHKMNGSMLIYLFGEQLGAHLWTKFAGQFKGNLLNFLSYLTEEYRFFILYELKTNKLLFAYC